MGGGWAPPPLPDAPGAPHTHTHTDTNPGPAQPRRRGVLTPARPADDFAVQMTNLYSDRQKGAKLNLFVKCRYRNTWVDTYPFPPQAFDYRALKVHVERYININPEICAELSKTDGTGSCDGENPKTDMWWEYATRLMAKEIYEKFDIAAISVMLQVQGGSSDIAGHRVSVSTIGARDANTGMYTGFEPWSPVSHWGECTGENANGACSVWGVKDKCVERPPLDNTFMSGKLLVCPSTREEPHLSCPAPAASAAPAARKAAQLDVFILILGLLCVLINLYIAVKLTMEPKQRFVPPAKMSMNPLAGA